MAPHLSRTMAPHLSRTMAPHLSRTMAPHLSRTMVSMRTIVSHLRRSTCLVLRRDCVLQTHLHAAVSNSTRTGTHWIHWTYGTRHWATEWDWLTETCATKAACHEGKSITKCYESQLVEYTYKVVIILLDNELFNI